VKIVNAWSYRKGCAGRYDQPVGGKEEKAVVDDFTYHYSLLSATRIFEVAIKII
jgi:hypothetical protein